MKRLLTCCLSFILMFAAAYADPVADDALLVLAELLAENADAAAESEEVHKLFSTPENIRGRIAAWAEGDHQEATSVYRIRLDDDILSMIIKVDSLPPVAATSLIQRAAISVISSLNAAYGAEALAASNITAISTGFTGTTECCVYILCYGEGADVAVCFYPFDSGTSGAYATFLAGDFEENHLADWQQESKIERLR